MASFLEVDEFMSQIQQLQFVALHKGKQAHRKKAPWQIVVFLQLNTWIIAYNIQFATYNIDTWNKMI